MVKRNRILIAVALGYIFLAGNYLARNPLEEGDIALPIRNRSSNAIPVLILACNRPEALRKVLQNVLYLTDSTAFPVTVSLDCVHEPTKAVVQSFKLDYIEQPDQRKITHNEAVFDIEGYHRVSRHYRWALNQMVNVRHRDATTLIILEDDLNISGDLFSYFSAFKELLEKDKSLLCVSGYNDNGKPENIDTSNPCRLWRSDLFPGLGWMTTSAIVRELLDKWPPAFWDDWLRSATQTKGRSCIRPEVSKTTTFGRDGISYGQFFDVHLARVKLNTERCTYNLTDVASMTGRAFERRMRIDFEAAPLVPPRRLNTLESGLTVKVNCRSLDEWKRVSGQLNIMSDVRPGGVRNMYHYVVPTFHRGSRVYVDVSELREHFEKSG